MKTTNIERIWFRLIGFCNSAIFDGEIVERFVHVGILSRPVFKSYKLTVVLENEITRPPSLHGFS